MRLRILGIVAVSLMGLIGLVCSPVFAEAPSGDILNSAPTSTICQDNISSDIGDSAVCQGAQQGNDASKNPFFGPNSLLGKIVQAIVFLVGALSVIMVVVGGFRYVLSGGDSSATKAAKDTILYAVIGLIIALFAQIFVSFVLTRNLF